MQAGPHAVPTRPTIAVERYEFLQNLLRTFLQGYK